MERKWQTRYKEAKETENFITFLPVEGGMPMIAFTKSRSEENPPEVAAGVQLP
jgi:hypothetical protein